MISIASDRVAIHDLSSIGVNHPRIRPPMNGGDNFTESRVPDPDESSGGSIVRRVGTDWMNGFKVGDMVWGKVKSHPWWPGHIFNESFASPPVRRSRREGHVLVAFFGDSSYGWFDPAELIPFEPNFPEKSHQTTSRNFLKAVEEAVDEFNRRAALGLTCRCRNPNNFRPTGVTGYFAVDVPGFEPGGIYSDLQINKSRDMFLPSEMVSFVRKLAASPRDTENHQSCDWLQSMEMMTAYRRAVFEEFDETYAQAFGVQPVRKLRQDDAGAGEQRERISSRAAPLSGKLVIAETLRGQNGSSKKPSAALKSNAKKNKYVLKRREGAPAAGASAVSRPKPLLPDLHQPSSATYLSQRPTTVFATPSTQQKAGAAGVEYAAAGGSQADNYVLQKRDAFVEDAKPSDFTYTVSDRPPDSPSTPPYVPVNLDGEWVMKTEQLPANTAVKNNVDISSMGFMQSDKPKLAKKIVKRKREEQQQLDGTGAADVQKKKKKKKKKELGSGGGEPRVVISKEEMQLKKKKVQELTKTPPACPAASLPVIDLSTVDLQLPDLVSDLTELALDPFFGTERNAPSIASQVFLKFRSLVYQKSLVLPPASELPEISKRPKIKKSTALAAQVKPLKRPLKPDDPTISGRKRGPSERQEEMSVKKIKKVEKIKALAADKKAGGVQFKSLPPPTEQQKDQQSVKLNKNEPVKRPEPPPPKIPCPTHVVMKFPQRTTLPSVATLKARFARFGQLDLSGTRVYWKSHTCKVLFKYKEDADAAANYAKDNDLFGQIKVNYTVREVEAPPSDQPPQNDSAALRTGGGLLGPTPALYRPSSTVLPKSILKKPSEDGGTSSGGVVKGVKFMLDSDPKDLPAPPPTPTPVPLISKEPRVSISAAPPRPPPPLNIPTTVATSRAPLPPPPSFPSSPGSNSSHSHGTPAQPMPWQAQPRYPPSHAAQDQGDTGTDISGPLLDLMLRTFKIIDNASNRTGYSPYDPIWRTLPL